MLALGALVLLALAIDGTAGQNQQQQYTTPVPILKQINRQNEDGSYSFGYEAADKSFKIETKYPNGEVYGKYGYVDDSGKVREVEYGASQRGFEPQGACLFFFVYTFNRVARHAPNHARNITICT